MKRYHYFTNQLTLFQFKNFLNYQKRHLKVILKNFSNYVSERTSLEHMEGKKLAASLDIEETMIVK